MVGPKNGAHHQNRCCPLCHGTACYIFCAGERPFPACGYSRRMGVKKLVLQSAIFSDTCNYTRAMLVGDDAVLDLDAEMVPADGGAAPGLPLLVKPLGEPAIPPLMPPPPPPSRCRCVCCTPPLLVLLLLSSSLSKPTTRRNKSRVCAKTGFVYTPPLIPRHAAPAVYCDGGCVRSHRQPPPLRRAGSHHPLRRPLR